MPTLVVKYSALVSDDNHCPTLRSIQPPRKFKTKVRAKALAQYKLRFNSLSDVDTKISELISKINTLPEGTFFSVGSLTQSANRKIAIAVGKEIANRCYPEGTYDFMSAYPGKWIYRRNQHQPEEVKDFDVDML